MNFYRNIARIRLKTKNPNEAQSFLSDSEHQALEVAQCCPLQCNKTFNKSKIHCMLFCTEQPV